jgi:hypothetical protein
LSHLEQGLGVHASGSSGHAHAHKSGHGPAGIACRCPHCIALGIHKGSRRHCRIPHNSRCLKLLDPVLVFFGCSAGNPEVGDLYAPAFPSLGT